MTGCTLSNEPVVPEIKYIDKVQYKKIDIPASLFYCNNIDVNASAIKTQVDAAILIINLQEALDRCVNKSTGIKNIYFNYLKDVEAEN